MGALRCVGFVASVRDFRLSRSFFDAAAHETDTSHHTLLRWQRKHVEELIGGVSRSQGLYHTVV